VSERDPEDVGVRMHRLGNEALAFESSSVS